jgi:hypothetical protein
MMPNLLESIFQLGMRRMAAITNAFWQNGNKVVSPEWRLLKAAEVKEYLPDCR